MDSPSTAQVTAREEITPRGNENPGVQAAQLNKSSTRGGRGGRGRGGLGKVRARESTRGGRKGGRGGTRNTRSQKGDPSNGWTLEKPSHAELVVEHEFANTIFSEQARLFCQSVVERLEVQKSVRELPTGRAGMIVLFVDPILRQCMEWTNQSITLHKSYGRTFDMSDMYKFLAIFLYSNCTGLSFEKTIQSMNMIGHKCLSLRDVRFISSNILGYSPIGRGNVGTRTWNSMRDETQQLSEFERTCFTLIRTVFLGSVQCFATLDDDLFGCRAVDNQVKSLSNRKADREGHMADVIADSMFRVVLGMRFRRRGESAELSVKKLMDMILDGRGEQALNSLTITADRGYGKESFTTQLAESGVSSMVVLPDHLLRCHPFVGMSYFNIERNDNVVEFMSSITSVDNVAEGVVPPTECQQQSLTEMGTVSQNKLPGVQNDGSNDGSPSCEFDRKRSFVIDDNSECGPAVFRAAKKRRGSQSIHAFAVREHGTEKYARVLRFYLNLPQSLVAFIDKWIAVPRPNVYNRNLFSTNTKNMGGPCIESTSTSGESGVNAATEQGFLLNNDRTFDSDATLDEVVFHDCNVPQDPKVTLESFLSARCTVLTVAQRCADWFIMRQFRVTGTNAGKILLGDAQFRSLIGVSGSAPERTLQVWSSIFVSSWFSTIRSTEQMKRGSINEDAVVRAIEEKNYVYRVYPCGMFSMKRNDFLACSPDGLVLIDLKSICTTFSNSTRAHVKIDEKCYAVSTLEIKTVIAENTVGNAIRSQTSDIIVCDFGDDTFKKFIPSEHAAQILQQMIVLNVNLCLYVRATETSLIYCALVHANSDMLTTFTATLISTAGPVVKWAHTSGIVPAYYRPSDKNAVQTHLSFWKIVNDKIKRDGPLPPVKIFKHGCQSVYSKTKGGVDGSAQMRSILRSSTSHLKWEQKIVTQVIKTVLVNSFISWRIYEQRQLLQSSQTFQSLDSFRHSLNTVQSLPDFIFDSCLELLDYSCALQRQLEHSITTEIQGNVNSGQPLIDENVKQLSARAKKCLRDRIPFFNSTEMREFRTNSLGHVPKHTRSKVYCSLCGVSQDGRRGHKSSFQCNLCHVYLCVRVWVPWRTSCWTMWHTNSELHRRVLPEMKDRRTGQTN